MRFILFTVTLFLLSSHCFAATLYSRSDGTWSLTNGGPDCICTPAGSDDIFVNHIISITGPFTMTGSITINSGGDLTITTGDLTIDGSGIVIINNNGSLNVDNDMFMLGDGDTTIDGDLIISGSLTMDDDAILTVQSGGLIDAGSNFDIESNTNAVTIDAGATVNVTDDFNNSSGSLVINGDLDIDGNFDNQQNGDITGSGTITYDGSCDSMGTVNGETGATVCDGSGVIDLGALPIELLFFKVVPKEKHVLLSWATASEDNFDFFSIERSADTQEFSQIGTIPGNGHSDIRIDYSYADRNPIVGRSFYRLKATDFDGTFEYFEIGTVVFDDRVINIFPNPIQNGEQLELVVSLASDERGLITVYSVIGEMIFQGQFKSGYYTLDVLDLRKGMHTVSIQYPGVIKASKLLVF